MTSVPSPAAPPGSSALARPRRRAAADATTRGVLPALAAVALAVVAAVVARWAPRGALLVVVVPVQASVALCWLTLTAVPARVAGTVVATAAGVLGAALLTGQHPATLGALAGAVGLGVVAAVLGQLLRRERSAVTDVLAAQCAAVLLTAGVAALCAVRGSRDGAVAAAVGLAGLGAALALGAATDLVGRRVWLGPQVAGRSLLGALLAVAGAAGTGAALHGADGVVLGPVAGVLAVLGDATVAVAAGPRRIGRPLAVLLPYALVGPGLFVAARVVFG